MSASQSSGFVLVGGQSLRMGYDKALLPFQGSVLALRLAERVRAAAGDVSLLGSAPKYAQLGLTIVEDLRPGAGPLSGIHSALKHTQARWNLIVGCDLPFITTEFLRFLVDIARHETETQLVVPAAAERGYELAAVFRDDALPAVEAALDSGEYKLARLYGRLRRREISPQEWRPFDPHGILFENVNTPEELARALGKVNGE